VRRSSFERRLRDELRSARPSRAAEAERRAWHLVKAAHSQGSVPRRRRRGARVAAAIVAAALLVAAALTPAGAKVGDWIDEVVSPAPEATRSALASLPADGRLLVVAEGGPWIVDDDGARRRLGAFADAGWSPGGLFLAAAKGRRLVALEPDGDERWTRVAPGRVATPRWSPDGYRIAYRSGRDLYIAVADNADAWLLDRAVRPTPPAWRFGQADNRQVLAYARGKRIHVVRADPPGRRLFRTAPGPVPRELWWSADGRRLIAVSRRSVRVHDGRGKLLRSVRLAGRLRASGSALAPDGRRLALIAAAPGARSSQLLLVRTDRQASPRRRLGGFGRLEGLTWSIDGRVLVAGLPQADQCLFLRMSGRGGLVSVKGIRSKFRGRRPARTGAFPRPAGWCYADAPDPAASGFPPCSAGASPGR
jgi:dipeptidyl aminopeptidase/acylaminoacyl peptidase